VYLNCILGVFNLIPIPPLDGYKVALVVLPDDLAAELVKLDRLGFMPIVFVLFVIPFLTGYNPVSEIMAPTVERVVELFTGTRFL
jgi:Zn-dependent protease